MAPSAIRKEVARAMSQRTHVTLRVMGDDGADEISFLVSATGHTPSDHTLDLVTGVTDDGKYVQVNIPTTDTPTLAIRPTTQ